MLVAYFIGVFLTNGYYCFSGDSQSIPVDLGMPDGNLTLQRSMESDVNNCGDMPGCEGIVNGLENNIEYKIHLLSYTIFNILLLVVICLLTQLATFLTLIKVICFSAKKVQYRIGTRNRDIVDQGETDNLRINETYI